MESTNLDEWFQTNIVNQLLVKNEDFQEKDSGWNILKIMNLMFNIKKYTPLTLGTFIELPANIANKKAIINIRNKDGYCFLWCIVAASYHYAFRYNNIIFGWQYGKFFSSKASSVG